MSASPGDGRSATCPLQPAKAAPQRRAPRPSRDPRRSDERDAQQARRVFQTRCSCRRSLLLRRNIYHCRTITPNRRWGRRADIQAAPVGLETGRRWLRPRVGDRRQGRVGCGDGQARVKLRVSRQRLGSSIGPMDFANSARSPDGSASARGASASPPAGDLSSRPARAGTRCSRRRGGTAPARCRRVRRSLPSPLPPPRMGWFEPHREGRARRACRPSGQPACGCGS